MKFQVYFVRHRHTNQFFFVDEKCSLNENNHRQLGRASQRKKLKQKKGHICTCILVEQM